MGYIDAEKLKSIIKVQIKERKEWMKNIDRSDRQDQLWSDLNGEDMSILQIINSLQQEQPEEICSKCIHHGKDDDYCYNPHGGMRSLINENGVYECTGFCEKEQEQPEVDLEKFTQNMNDWKARYNHPDNIPIKATMAFTARMFYQYPNVARQWYDSLPKATMD